MTISPIAPADIGKRFKKLLTGDNPDRPLVWLYGAVPSFAVRNVGYPGASAYNDPEKCFDAQIKTISMYGEDGIPRIAVGGTLDVAFAFGVDIKWPDGDYQMAPSTTVYPVDAKEDVEKLTLTDDIIRSGPLPLYEKFAEKSRDFGLPVFIFVTSPIEGARSLCGPDNLMRWMIKEPGIIHKLLRIATDYSIGVVDHFTKSFQGEDILVYLATPTASNQVISPEMFESFVLPYQIELHKSILNRGIRNIFCHICGDQNMNLKYWCQVPMGDPGIASFGHEVDLKDAIRYLGKNCVIAGNIEPAIIRMGRPDDIYDLCKKAINKGIKAPRGFILMPGCGIPPDVPPYSLFMLKKAVDEFT